MSVERHEKASRRAATPRDAVKKSDNPNLSASPRKVKLASGKRHLCLQFPFRGENRVYKEKIEALHELSFYGDTWSSKHTRAYDLAGAKRHAFLDRSKIEFIDTARLAPTTGTESPYGPHGVEVDHTRAFRDASGDLLFSAEPYHGWGDLKEAELTPLRGGWVGSLMPEGYGFHNPGYGAPQTHTRLIFLSPPGGADLAPIVETALRVLKPIPREL
jgi:hypothetical protein